MTGAAFFDLDKTVLSKSSTLALSKTMYREGFISKTTLVKGVFAQLVYLIVGADEARMEKMRATALALTTGWERDRVLKMVKEVIEDVIRPLVYAEALDLIRSHQEAGRRVYIVSTSPEEVVLPLAEGLGADDVIATRAEVEGGRYTGNLDFYCFGPSKAEAMRDEALAQQIDLSESYAYSDSATDAWMLYTVGHPHAVNPDKELRRIAVACDWPILSFRHPVRLHRRIVRPTPVRLTAVAAAAAGLVAWGLLRPRKRRVDARTLRE